MFSSKENRAVGEDFRAGAGKKYKMSLENKEVLLKKWRCLLKTPELTGGAPSEQSRNELNDKINEDSIGLKPTKSNKYP